MTIDNAWLAYLDAYGFGHRASDHSPTALLFLQAIADQVRLCSPHVDIICQFSDSVFLAKAAAPDPFVSFASLVEQVKTLQTTALTHDAVFRGVITFGTVSIGPFGSYGSPIVQAVKLEKDLLPPVVVLPERYIAQADHAFQLHGSSRRLRDRLRVEEVSTKLGALNCHVVETQWDMYGDLAQRELARALMNGPDHIVPAWRSAVALAQSRG